MKLTKKRLEQIIKEEIITERLKRFKVYVSGESQPLILMGKNEKEVKQTAHMMIKNSSIRIRKVVREGKLTETTVRISTMKDANFSRGMVQLMGKKGQVGLDRKSVSALVKIIRSGKTGTGMGRSFTQFDSYNPKGKKLTEGKIHRLPNGIKVKVEFKGITFSGTRGDVFLNRTEMRDFFKATHKYLK